MLCICILSAHSQGRQLRCHKVLIVSIDNIFLKALALRKTKQNKLLKFYFQPSTKKFAVLSTEFTMITSFVLRSNKEDNVDDLKKFIPLKLKETDLTDDNSQNCWVVNVCGREEKQPGQGAVQRRTGSPRLCQGAAHPCMG